MTLTVTLANDETFTVQPEDVTFNESRVCWWDAAGMHWLAYRDVQDVTLS